jgi:macrolide transport system ATP-binding/permease protein
MDPNTIADAVSKHDRRCDREGGMPMNFRRFFKRSNEDSELSAELESHLAHEMDDNLARGMSPEEARRMAYVKLGNPQRIRDRVWETNRIGWLEDVGRDLRYAARTLAKAPSFTLVALLVMALGIGANTAIYSFLDSLLLRSLPVADPASLVILSWHAKTSPEDTVMQSMSGEIDDDPHLGLVSGIFPYRAFEILQKNTSSAFDAKDGVFTDVFAYCHTREVRNASVNIGGRAESAKGELVSGDYFHGLQVAPATGRLILPDDDRVGATPVVVASHAFAEKHFGRVANAVGQPVLINNVAFTIAGVAPAEFFGVDPELVPDFYVPLHTNLLLGAGDPFAFSPADYLDQNYYWLQTMGRLRPGVTMAQAEAQLAPQFKQWVATTAQNDVQRSNLPVLFLREGAGGLDTLRRRFSKPLYVLMTLVGLILAIACSNVANLQIVRGASRRREIALRLTEGASRMRVIRQLLTESILLASMGGALGLLVAFWGIRFLTLLLGASSNLGTAHAELNWHVAAFTAALSLLTGVLFGLVPALQSTKLDLVTALKETRWQQPRPRHASSGSGFGFSNIWASLGSVGLSQVLVAGQIALSLLILVAAGLFVRTLSNLESVNLGFNRDNLLLFELNGRQSGHRDGEINDFYNDLRERFAAIPGVASAGLADRSMIGGDDQMPIGLPGAQADRRNRFRSVGPRFLTTMQIPILTGRDIDEHDRTTSKPVAVVNEEFVKINFPGRNPIGHHLLLWKGASGSVARDMEIVGVAKNASYGGLKREILPVIYLPFNQGFPLPNDMMFALRTNGDPLSYENTVREIVHQADSRLPVSRVRTQQAEVDDQVRQETILAELCTAFAVLALTIACVGLYGTISYTVARRTGEIGIRMALGAQRVPVLWMVLREVLVLAAVGLAISIPIALGTSKFVESFLFGMKGNDPLALGLAVMILLLAALLAGGIPARRAAQIDPMTALRHE